MTKINIPNKEEFIEKVNDIFQNDYQMTVKEAVTKAINELGEVNE